MARLCNLYDKATEVFNNEKIVPETKCLPDLHEHLSESMELHLGNYVMTRDKAKDILPTSRGFFFGSDHYDDYYFDQLQETIDSITPILSDGDIKDGDLYYYGWY